MAVHWKGSVLNVMSQVFQDRKTGKRVKVVGGLCSKEEFVLVSNGTEPPFYCHMDQLIPCDDKGTPDLEAPPRQRIEPPEEKAPEPLIPFVETRLNLNMATPEDIHRRIPGVGYRIAKRIVDARLALPGERFTTLEQVTSVASRVDWDTVLKQNLVYVS